MATDHYFNVDVHVDKFENKTITKTDDYWEDVDWKL